MPDAHIEYIQAAAAAGTITWPTGKAGGGPSGQFLDLQPIPNDKTGVPMFNSLRPTTIDGTKTTRTTRMAATAAAALSLGMAALPLAMAPAASAAATGTLGPCTVTAEKPYHTGNFTLSGKKLIAYPIKASCTRSDVKVIMKQIILEDDPDVWPISGNDVQKDWYTPAGTPLHFTAPGTKKVSPVPLYRLTRTLDDLGGAEEVFHRVQFWVSSNGVTQGPKVVSSANTSIHP